MTWKRTILESPQRQAVTEALNDVLADLTDLSLQIKMAHWNVSGQQFRAVHLQLDEIVDDVRTSLDEVAERMTTLSTAPDGNVKPVASNSRLEHYPGGFIDAPQTISLVADRLAQTVEGVRTAIKTTGEVDPVTEDLLIATSQGLEKHLWMLQAQEGAGG